MELCVYPLKASLLWGQYQLWNSPQARPNVCTALLGGSIAPVCHSQGALGTYGLVGHRGLSV